MSGKLPKNTPEILRKYGLKVETESGWENRAVAGPFEPVGVLCHHTATTAKTSNDNVASLLKNGRSDLPGPLCNFGLRRDGTVVIIAAGRCNHGGDAKAFGTVAKGNANTLYYSIEAYNDGVGEPWNAVQYNAYVLLAAVISVEFTKNSEKTVNGHKETSVTGKIDPTFDMGTFRERVGNQMEELKHPKPAGVPVTVYSRGYDVDKAIAHLNRVIKTSKDADKKRAAQASKAELAKIRPVKVTRLV